MALDLKHPSLNFAAASGLKIEVPEDKEGEQQVPLTSLRTLGKHPSAGPDPEGHKFKSGDEVTVIRRMSVKLPHTTDPKYRKDVVVGTQGWSRVGWTKSIVRSFCTSLCSLVRKLRKKGSHSKLQLLSLAGT